LTAPSTFSVEKGLLMKSLAPACSTSARVEVWMSALAR